MPATITYKGETLASFSNSTKTMLTSGKYMEDDITITDMEQTEVPISWAKMSYSLSSLGLTWVTLAEENI